MILILVRKIDFPITTSPWIPGYIYHFKSAAWRVEKAGRYNESLGYAAYLNNATLDAAEERWGAFLIANITRALPRIRQLLQLPEPMDLAC